MRWSQFVRLLDAMGFPNNEMWTDWAWKHFNTPYCKSRSLSTEQVILAIGYVMWGAKAEAVHDIEVELMSQRH